MRIFQEPLEMPVHKENVESLGHSDVKGKGVQPVPVDLLVLPEPPVKLVHLENKELADQLDQEDLRVCYTAEQNYFKS
jgi:hypothetical protein